MSLQIQQLEEVQETEQKQQQITFEELCPNYTAKLGMWDNLTMEARQRLANIIRGQSANCIVGEAHGYSSEYVASCGDCQDFASLHNGFPSAFFWSTQLDHDKFEFIKERFMIHWNKEHTYHG